MNIQSIKPQNMKFHLIPILYSIMYESILEDMYGSMQKDGQPMTT